LTLFFVLEIRILRVIKMGKKRGDWLEKVMMRNMVVIPQKPSSKLFG